jgi:hypothetical protein
MKREREMWERVARVARESKRLCKAAREPKGASTDLWNFQGQNSPAKSKNSVKGGGKNLAFLKQNALLRGPGRT